MKEAKGGDSHWAWVWRRGGLGEDGRMGRGKAERGWADEGKRQPGMWYVFGARREWQSRGRLWETGG